MKDPGRGGDEAGHRNPNSRSARRFLLHSRADRVARTEGEDEGRGRVSDGNIVSDAALAGEKARRQRGWAPWLAWGLGALFFFYGFVQRVAPSVMIDELMRDFGVGAAAIGNLAAIYLYAYVLLQLPVGLLMDRVGPRRLLAGASAVAALGSLVFALSGSFAVAGAGRFLIGFGSAAGWVGTLVIATRLFPPQRFALLTGLAQALGMVGAVCGQAPLGAAVTAWGWRPSLVGLAGLGLLLAAALWMVLRDDERRGEGGGTGALVAGLRRVVAVPQSWLASVVSLSLTGPMLAFAALWAVPFFVAKYGLGLAEAAGLASLLSVGWGVGAPVIGLLSDRWQRRRSLLLVGTATSTLALAGAIYLPLGTIAAGALLLVAGIAGSSMVVTYAAAREWNRPADSGAVYGFVNTATVGSGAVLQPLLGYLLDRAWTGEVAGGARVYSLAAYEQAMLVLPAVGLAGFLAALLLREGARRPALRG
jgi:MFS family permease